MHYIFSKFAFLFWRRSVGWMGCRVLPALGLLILFNAASASARTLEKSYAAGWDVGAYSNDNTGAFSHCGISASYNSGIILIFTLDPSSRWGMAMGNPSWRLTIGSSYPLSFSIDGGQFYSATGQAIATDEVRIELPDRVDLYNRFRYGSTLYVQALAGNFTFNLTGTNQALAALISCTNRWSVASNGSQTTDPFSAASKPQGEVSSQEHEAEAVTLASNLLSAAGIAGFSIQSPQDGQKTLPGYDAVWTAPSLIGGIMVIPTTSQGDVDKSFSVLSSKDAQVCKGKFAATRPPLDAQTAGTVLGRLITACDTSAGSAVVYYTIFGRRNGGLYLSTVIGFQNADGDTPAKQADSQILNAVYNRQGNAGNDSN